MRMQDPPYDAGSFAKIVTRDASKEGGSAPACSSNVRQVRGFMPSLFLPQQLTHVHHCVLTQLAELCFSWLLKLFPWYEYMQCCIPIQLSRAQCLLTCSFFNLLRG